MSSTTTNFGLHKIDLNDAPPDITVLNQNWDTIDEELGNIGVAVEEAVKKDGDVMTGSLTVMDNFNVNKTFDDVEYKTYVRPINYSIGSNGDYSTGLIHYKNGVNNAQLMFNKDGVMLRDNVNAKAYQMFGQHNTDLIKDICLPLTGGTLSGYELWLQNGKARLFSGDNVFRLDVYNEPKTDNNRRALWMANSSKNDAVDIKDAFRFVDVINGTTKLYRIYGQHNKPTGTYTGNGSATSRTIQIGGIGELLMINSVNATCIVSSHGASYWCNDDGTTKYKGNPTIKFENGQLTITSSEKFFNSNGVSYTYRVL